MKYSAISLKILALKECGILRTNTQFWRDFASIEKINGNCNQNKIVSKIIDELEDLFSREEFFDLGMICVFDDDFPCINYKAKESEKPYLLFYRGNVSLLKNLNNNVAVIGLTNPTDDIESRERTIVEKLIENRLVIVSGLAKGCDEVAHKTCVEKKSKTIAILPTTLLKISPASNRQLANEIVDCGGLLITEYFKEATNRSQAIGRYAERDRLQALFSKAVIMIASYRKGEGDSGSRYAMSYAENYEIKRYIMYNEKTDGSNKQFALNKEFASKGVESLSSAHIDKLTVLENEKLTQKVKFKPEQISFI